MSKQFGKKLKITKSTLMNLDNDRMEKVRGGRTNNVNTECAQCTDVASCNPTGCGGGTRATCKCTGTCGCNLTIKRTCETCGVYQC